MTRCFTRRKGGDVLGQGPSGCLHLSLAERHNPRSDSGQASPPLLGRRQGRTTALSLDAVAALVRTTHPL